MKHHHGPRVLICKKPSFLRIPSLLRSSIALDISRMGLPPLLPITPVGLPPKLPLANKTIPIKGIFLAPCFLRLAFPPTLGRISYYRSSVLGRFADALGITGDN